MISFRRVLLGIILVPFLALANGDDAHDDGLGGALVREESGVREGLIVNLNATPVPYLVGTTTRLDFIVNEKPGNVPVSFSQLDISHTKLIHVIGVRSDLNEFIHIHPRPITDIPGTFSINHIFSKPGLYKFWSEIKKDGVDYTFGHPELSVQGEGERDEKVISLGRNVIIGDNTLGNYQVVLEADDILGKGLEYEFAFDVHTATGQGVLLEEYLGDTMHLVIIKEDLGQFIHSHPENADEHSLNSLIHEAYANDTNGGVASESINFHVSLSEKGFYRAFVQFRPQGIDLPQGEALTAAFWIQVQDSAPASRAVWWGLLIVSLVLTAGLSWITNRYIKGKV